MLKETIVQDVMIQLSLKPVQETDAVNTDRQELGIYANGARTLAERLMKAYYDRLADSDDNQPLNPALL